MNALIIDDSPDIRLSLSAMLRQQGLVVSTANDGDHGLVMARDQQPDIICLDLMLPTVSGLEVCRRLREMPETRHIPVIIVSARPFPQDRASASQAGADAFISKPLNRQTVTATVRELLWRQRTAVGA
jgi:DNA-binding response OmpR family regulator